MSTKDFAHSLDQGFPEAWRPDQGGENNPNPLIGVFKEMNSASTAYGPCWVMTIELEDGTERTVWLIHTVLRNELARARPEPGERIGIKYMGKQGEGQTAYVGYRVKVDRPQGRAFDWGKLGGDPEVVDDLPDPPVVDRPQDKSSDAPLSSSKPPQVDEDIPF